MPQLQPITTATNRDRHSTPQHIYTHAGHTLIFTLTLIYDLEFQFRATVMVTAMHVQKIKVSRQSVQQIEWKETNKRTDRRTQPIAYSAYTSYIRRRTTAYLLTPAVTVADEWIGRSVTSVTFSVCLSVCLHASALEIKKTA